MSDVRFGMFDPDAEVDRSVRFLPHWFQPGVAVFLTFRTRDSMPADVVLRWQTEQREWLQRQGISLNVNDPLPEITSLPQRLRASFQQHRDRLFHWQLDACHGECVLRQPDLARLVIDSLWHFDGQRYDIDSAIVMPNHVHLLVQFRSPTTCREQCTSWLHFTAAALNRKLGRKGAFWQSEPFDHLVRSPEQFAYLRRYIAENGLKAKLPATDYLYVDRRSASATAGGTGPTRE